MKVFQTAFSAIAALILLYPSSDTVGASRLCFVSLGGLARATIQQDDFLLIKNEVPKLIRGERASPNQLFKYENPYGSPLRLIDTLHPSERHFAPNHVVGLFQALFPDAITLSLQARGWVQTEERRASFIDREIEFYRRKLLELEDRGYLEEKPSDRLEDLLADDSTLSPEDNEAERILRQSIERVRKSEDGKDPLEMADYLRRQIRYLESNFPEHKSVERVVFSESQDVEVVGSGAENQIETDDDIMSFHNVHSVDLRPETSLETLSVAQGDLIIIRIPAEMSPETFDSKSNNDFVQLVGKTYPSMSHDRSASLFFYAHTRSDSVVNIEVNVASRANGSVTTVQPIEIR